MKAALIRTAATINGPKSLPVRRGLALTVLLAIALLIAALLISRASNRRSASPSEPQDMNRSPVSTEQQVEGDSASRLAPNAIEVTAQAAEDAAAKAAEAVRKAGQR